MAKLFHARSLAGLAQYSIKRRFGKKNQYNHAGNYKSNLIDWSFDWQLSFALQTLIKAARVFSPSQRLRPNLRSSGTAQKHVAAQLHVIHHHATTLSLAHLAGLRVFRLCHQPLTSNTTHCLRKLVLAINSVFAMYQATPLLTSDQIRGSLLVIMQGWL